MRSDLGFVQRQIFRATVEKFHKFRVFESNIYLLCLPNFIKVYVANLAVCILQMNAIIINACDRHILWSQE